LCPLLKTNTTQLDLKQFEVLYKTYQPGLVNFAFFYLKNEQEAIDLVQELFISIWEKKDSSPITDNPKSYLMTSVKNRCFNKLTRNKNNSNSIELLGDILISQEDTSSAIETKQTEEQILKSIDKLPEKCKEIFVLSRFEQMSYKEIAATLNISAKTVENQIGNALKFLRKEL
jgi:RNA polymerase sigma-70 factor (family 1)